MFCGLLLNFGQYGQFVFEDACPSSDALCGSGNPSTLPDITQTGEVLHREEKILFLDASYISSSAYLGNPR